MRRETLLRTLLAMTMLAVAGGALALGFILGFNYGDSSSSEFRLDGRANACEARIEARLTRLDDPTSADLRDTLTVLPDECAPIADRIDPELIAAMESYQP